MPRDSRVSVNHACTQEIITTVTTGSAAEAGPLIQECVDRGHLKGVEWACAHLHEESGLLTAHSWRQPDGTHHQLSVLNAKVSYVAESEDGKAVCHTAAILAKLGFLSNSYKSICQALREPSALHTFVNAYPYDLSEEGAHAADGAADM